MSSIVCTRLRAEFASTRAMLAQIERQTRKALVSQGAYIRGVSKKSLAPRDHPSKPGKPPRSVTGLLRDFIFWAYDPLTKSVVVGPAPIKTEPIVPRLLEEGGSEMAHVRVGKAWKYQAVHIAARPYMAPALTISQQRLPEFWAKSVT